MNQSNPDFTVTQFQRQDSLTGMSLGQLKPELYKQRSLDGEDDRSSRVGSCGRLHFILKYDCDLEQLIVKIHRAQDLPAKDFSGTSDPYVKIYLLPDRKTKHQTKVHRKTLNPVFDEVFLFPVAYADLPTRKLHFSVYDFDRFSRHDIIGQVVVDNFLDLVDFPRETKLCRDIQYVSSVSTCFMLPLFGLLFEMNENYWNIWELIERFRDYRYLLPFVKNFKHCGTVKILLCLFIKTRLFG